MTKPLHYIENQFARVSRGTLNGLPLLMPGEDDKLRDEIAELFRRNACRFEITILALSVEPCGYEAIIFDPKMKRSSFFKSVNQGISMKVKQSIDHCESVWSNQKPGNVPILDFETLVNEIFKICVKPVRRGFVEKVNQWVLPQLGPEKWFQKDCMEDGLSRNVEDDLLGVTVFPSRDRGPGSDRTCDESKKRERFIAVFEKLMSVKFALLDRISAFQKTEKIARKERFRTVLGPEACRKRTSFIKAASRNREDYNSPKPKVLCACKDRIVKAISYLKAYYAAYRLALVQFIRTKKAIFPSGILKMKTLFRVRSAEDNSDALHFTL